MKPQHSQFEQASTRALLYFFSTFLIFICSSSQAREQPFSFYYGAGAGIAVPQVNGLDTGVFGELVPQVGGLDTGVFGELVLGIEENGWALEATGFSGLDTGTDAPNVDYAIQGYHLGLSYRSIMRNNSYSIFKIASTNMDFDFSGNISGVVETSGISYSLGAGWRMAANQKLEAIYTYYDSDDIDDPVHMASLRYLWDDSGSGSASGSPGAFYAGAALGLLEPDLGGDFEVANTYAIVLGYDLGLSSAPGLSIELLLGASAETDSFATEPEFPDTYTTSYLGLYGVFRSSGSIYFKGRLGLIKVNFEDDLYTQAVDGSFEFDETDKFSDSGLSYGAGVGLKAGERFSVELEYTRSSFTISDFSIDPEILSLSLLYSF
ncbi:hypothetical protein MNBD_GAMMA10-3379 [hydrothermal vent metagenome]|uniref:Outer membrane protein beta-barrel domain-containing protein n=1 Tax=hydrothermal vent metagenome TaxID=652676 RepID=A0A3B0YGW0_9ZZZZ